VSRTDYAKEMMLGPVRAWRWSVAQQNQQAFCWNAR
jgi:hypothetical protein